jgi:hypothetical protein
MTTSLDRGRAARLALYFRQVFPLQQMVPYAACHFFALWFSLQAMAGLPVVRVSWTAIRGAASVLLFLLLMRVYDELKDAASDLALARSGDPRYRDRALVTGAVRIEDIKFLRWTVTAALIALNIWPVTPWATLAFWTLFGVGWLSFRWFFWPPMSRRLLIAFITHNPIALFLDAYIVALFADTFAFERVDGDLLILLLGLWLPMAAWETSRKIRVPQDETAYQTYSLLLGWKTASLLPAFFVIASAIALAYVAAGAGLGSGLLFVLVAAAGVVVYRCALFRFAPSRDRADLKPWTTFYTSVANAGLVIAVLVEHRLAW